MVLLPLGILPQCQVFLRHFVELFSIPRHHVRYGASPSSSTCVQACIPNNSPSPSPRLWHRRVAVQQLRQTPITLFLVWGYPSKPPCLAGALLLRVLGSSPLLAENLNNRHSRRPVSPANPCMRRIFECRSPSRIGPFATERGEDWLSQ